MSVFFNDEMVVELTQFLEQQHQQSFVRFSREESEHGVHSLYLICVCSGHLTAQNSLGEQVQYVAGDLVVTDHRLNVADVTGDCVYFSFRIDEAFIVGYKSIGREDSGHSLFNLPRDFSFSTIFMGFYKQLTDSVSDSLLKIRQHSFSRLLMADFITFMQKSYEENQGYCKEYRVFNLLCAIAANFPFKYYNRQELAAYLQVSPQFLSSTVQLFRKMNYQQYLNFARLEYSRNLLVKDASISAQEISEKVGFANLSHFIQAFKKAYVMTPKQFRKAHYGTDADRPDNHTLHFTSELDLLSPAPRWDGPFPVLDSSKDQNLVLFCNTLDEPLQATLFYQGEVKDDYTWKVHPNTRFEMGILCDSILKLETKSGRLVGYYQIPWKPCQIIVD